MMIYVTGDTHGWIDYNKCYQLDSLKVTKKKMRKTDYLIVLGDFGILWDRSERHLSLVDAWNKKPYTVLFIDGNHENHDTLNAFPVETWNSGKIHRVSSNIIHLMRGQVFVIDGIKFFTMGGADSVDKEHRLPNISWWKEELPSFQEYDEGLANLEQCDWVVDYILSHACSNYTFYKLCKDHTLMPIVTALNHYFDQLEKEVMFKHWYFGHYHIDMKVDDSHTALYDNIIKICKK